MVDFSRFHLIYPAPILDQETLSFTVTGVPYDPEDIPLSEKYKPAEKKLRWP